MFDLGKESIDFSCPECGRKNHATLTQVSRQATIICLSCRTNIKLTDKNGSAGRSVRDINNAMKSLENAFKKLR